MGIQNGFKNQHSISSAERSLPSGQFVKHNAEREQITASINFFSSYIPPTTSSVRRLRTFSNRLEPTPVFLSRYWQKLQWSAETRASKRDWALNGGFAGNLGSAISKVKCVEVLAKYTIG